VKFHGWDSSTVIAAPQKLPSLMTTKSVNGNCQLTHVSVYLFLCIELGKRALRRTLELPFDGPLVEIMLEHDHGNEYGLRISVGQENVQIKFERHCRVSLYSFCD
jgi:hypothetical protein